MKIRVSPDFSLNDPSARTLLSRTRTEVVPTAQILFPFFLVSFNEFAVLAGSVNDSSCI